MSKRHVRELCRVYEKLALDASNSHPTLTQSLARDSQRLRRLIESRGISFLTIDLPSLGKHLDRCLSEGQYTPSGLPGSAPVNRRIQTPKLFGGMYLLIFDETGCLLEHPDVSAVFFLRQFYYLAKKTEIECSPELNDREIAIFVETDSELPEPSRFWETGKIEDYTFTTFKEAALDEVSDPDVTRALGVSSFIAGCVSGSLGSYEPLDFQFRHGPGVCSDTSRFSNKYCWRNWDERLERCFPIADCGFHSYSSWAASYHSSAGEQDSSCPSRLYCVPKSARGPRIICAEPSERMWCQQNIWNYFRDRTEQSWIKDFIAFGDQRLNQGLCLQASLDGSLVTLDLSRASDRVTPSHVAALFSGNPFLLQCLAATRTQHVLLPCGEVHKLRKYAAMGNATTFPVQSLLFLTVCLAAVLVKRKMPLQASSLAALKGEVAVFGDDLIVPTDSWEIVVKTLEALGFVVNAEKSYCKGFFRESCGHDYYRGNNVTPIYWKGLLNKTPESVSMTVSMHNNFVKKFLMHTARHIGSTLPVHLRDQVVRAGSDRFGLYSYDPTFLSRRKSRYNEGLQRWEILEVLPSSRVKKSPIDNDSALLQFFTEYSGPGLPWKSGFNAGLSSFMTKTWVSMHDFTHRDNEGDLN